MGSLLESKTYLINADSLLIEEILIFPLGQRSAKLQAIKVGGLKKNSAAQPTMLYAFQSRMNELSSKFNGQ